MIHRAAYFTTCSNSCHGKIASVGEFVIQGMTTQNQCLDAMIALRDLELISQDEFGVIRDQIMQSPLPESNAVEDGQFSMALAHFSQSIGDLRHALTMMTEESHAFFNHGDNSPGDYLSFEIVDPDNSSG